jgi:hypothetical protein
VGTLENFDASQAPRTTNYDAEEFRTVDGKEAKTVVKKGKICKQDYELKSGVAKMSGLEIMQNYAEALPAEGMRVTNTNRANDDDVFATVTKGSKEYWIHVRESNGNGLHVLVLQVAPFQANIVAAGATDCPLVPVQQNFQTAQKPSLRTFDEEEFLVPEGDGQKRAKKTGAVCKQDYDLKPGVARMSGLEIMQTYAEALPAAGMTITNAKRNADDDVDATMTRDGTTYWVRVWESNGNGLHILVLQDTPFQAHLAPPGADDCPVIPVQQNFQITSQRYLRTYDVKDFRRRGRPRQGRREIRPDLPARLRPQARRRQYERAGDHAQLCRGGRFDRLFDRQYAPQSRRRHPRLDDEGWGLLLVSHLGKQWQRLAHSDASGGAVPFLARRADCEGLPARARA